MKIFKIAVFLYTFFVITNLFCVDYYFSGRKEPKSLIFKDKIFILGGTKGYSGKVQLVANDIWISNYGDTWEKLDTRFIQPSRSGFVCAVFKEKIWVIGGYDQASVKYLGDVWNSTDGINWELVTKKINVPKRVNATMVVFKDKLWIIGGLSEDGQPLSDVWSSENGYDWIKVGDSHAINSFFYSPVVVFKDRLFYFSFGRGIFSSIDGLNWEPLSDKNDIVSKRSFYTVEVFQDYIYVICGQYKTEDTSMVVLSNEIIRSKDCKEWEVVSPEYDFLQRGDIYHRFSINPVRKNQTSIVFKDRIFIFGGETGNNSKYLSDIWFTTDGLKWIQIR